MRHSPLKCSLNSSNKCKSSIKLKSSCITASPVPHLPPELQKPLNLHQLVKKSTRVHRETCSACLRISWLLRRSDKAVLWPQDQMMWPQIFVQTIPTDWELPSSKCLERILCLLLGTLVGSWWMLAGPVMAKDRIRTWTSLSVPKIVVISVHYPIVCLHPWISIESSTLHQNSLTSVTRAWISNRWKLRGTSMSGLTGSALSWMQAASRIASLSPKWAAPELIWTVSCRLLG